EIDHADDAVDHGVADGDQAIDRAEHEAVDQLLGEIIHALPCLESDAARSPGSPNPRVVSFSNSGNPGRQQRRPRSKGLYRGRFAAGSPCDLTTTRPRHLQSAIPPRVQLQARDRRLRPIWPCTYSRSARLMRVWSPSLDFVWLLTQATTSAWSRSVSCCLTGR